MKAIFRQSVIMPGLVLISCGVLLAEPGRNALYYLREGERQAAARDYRAAAHNFRLAIKENPGHTRAHLGAARAHYALNDLPRAREHYQRVLELDAENLPARIGLGLTYVRLRLFDEAGRLLREVRDKEPANVENNFALGLYYRRQGNARLAEAYYRKAIRVSPSHVGSLVGLARVMADQNRPDLAEDFLRRARQVDPVYPEIYMARGEIELRRAFSEGDPERRTTLLESAYEALVTAIRLAPDDMRVEEQLVRIDLYRNRPDAALERAADIVRRNPRNPMLLYLMATVQAHRGGDARAAVARMRQALELDPGNSLIRFSLEEAVLAHTGQFPATGALRRGLAAYHFQRARYYDSIQRRDLTGHHVRRALLLYPFHEAALRLELERYRRTGDYELFIRTLQRLRRTNPDDLKLRHRLELSLREKNNSLAFRAGLFHAESNPDQANYERTPLRVFVFDFRPLEAFPAHPDGPDRFARALAFELERGGPVKAVPADVRETVLGRIRALETNAGRYSYGTYYEPGYINLIDEERQTRSQDVTHIVSGHYRSLGEGFEITYELTEQSTGSLVSRFTLTASGRDALAELSVRAADRINRLLGARGRVIRVRPNQIFVNLGEIDGLKKGTILNVYRLGAWRGRLIVAESATYIARCEPQNTSWDRLDPGDVVVPIRK